MKIQFPNFAVAQKEAIDNYKISIKGPADISLLSKLKTALAKAKDTLPPVYRKSLYEPYVAFVDQLTAQDFKDMMSNPDSKSYFYDFAQVILQHADGYEAEATGAYQEVVADLYDGFLSEEDRYNIKRPDYDVITPIVRWGNPKYGPYTIPIEQTIKIHVENAIVCLPPALAKGVLVAWASLAHETAGHDIASADAGLVDEMKLAVKNAILADKTIQKPKIKNKLANYWSRCIDETSADIMGILNMGPAAAITLIPFFRAFIKNMGGTAELSSDGPSWDEHPADILRVMLGSAAVKLLSFGYASAWAEAILTEGLKDLETIVLDDDQTSDGMVIDPVSAQKSADIVAKTLITSPLHKLNDHSLIEIQDWKDHDEQIVAILRKVLTKQGTPSPDILKGAYAAHVVAAAVYEALMVKQPIAPLFKNMISQLKQMHDANAGWGPLYALNPGSMKKHVLKYMVR